MAKKGAPTALQTDVTNDEEWAKILERKGLVLADIYSEFSGPCVGMISILKKIKIEIGGDNLSYATARCDNITSLVRFRGQSEPTWMFIREGKIVNLLFGSSCPRLTEALTDELKRLETGQPPKFSIPIEEMTEEEIARRKEIDQKKIDKYAEENAKRDAARKEKYEAELGHYVNALYKETILILLPWLFRDEEGNEREKNATPAYTELIEQLLPENFSIDRELRMQLEEQHVTEMQKETSFVLSEESKRLLLDGKCLVMRLKYIEKPDIDMESVMFNLLYGEPAVAQTPDDLVEECYVHRNLPPLEEFVKDLADLEKDPEKLRKILCVTTVWVPVNPRNKTISYRALFPKYVQDNYPYEDEDASVPVTIFKYDSSKVRELQKVHEKYDREVVKYGIFERDKLPDPNLVARTILQFEELPPEIQKKAVFVWVVKHGNMNVFLSFAGLGPYYVSEDPEKGEEEALQYFPRESTVSDEVQADEEEKPVEEKPVEEKPSEEQPPQDEQQPAP